MKPSGSAHRSSGGRSWTQGGRMDTGQALTARLRNELNCPSLTAQVVNDRWCVFEVTRELTPGRDVPFRLSDSGEVLPGEATIREVTHRYHMIYIHEGRNGEYLPADPLPILQALRKQDKWTAGDPAQRALDVLRRNRERARKESSDHFADLSDYYRKLVARAADEVGL